MLSDYSEILEGYDLSKTARGRYSHPSPQQREPIVKIPSDNGVRYVTMKTIEVEAIVTPDGQLTVEIHSDLKPGKYRAALILEAPVNLSEKETE
ncbi:MAG: hypothetical protein AB4426_12115 [Xenococcaceae cyanobacterium]